MFKGIFGGGGEEDGPGTEKASDAAAASGQPQSDPGIFRGATFDPRALETAAELLREVPGLNGQAFLLTKQQALVEERKKLEGRSMELHGYVRQLENAIYSKMREESNKTNQMQHQENEARERYKDSLARKRDADVMDAQRVEREREMKLKEDMAQREDVIRRKTLEYDADLRQQTELNTVKAQTEGRIQAERQNHDIRMEERRAAARETRQTLLESIKLVGDTMGKGVGAFLGDRDEMVAAVATLSAVAVGVYSAKTGTGVAGRYISSRLGKPSLVRETSRHTLMDFLGAPAKGFMRWGTGFFKGDKAAKALEGDEHRPRAVFEPVLANRLMRIADSTANTRANQAPYRHLLLYGPPGTGKTLFAKGLALHSGMDYAIVTGGDVAPLGREAVTEVHKVFDWAQNSSNGVLLFVDEADAFLRRRSTEVISESMRNALNAFLYRTGEQSEKVMLVYASNQPEQFDDAVNDRIDEMVHFELPGSTERRRMLNIYLEKYLLTPPTRWGAKTIVVEGIEDEHMDKVVEATDGFSGREISKLAIAWQAAAYGSEKCVLTPEVFLEVLDDFVLQKSVKVDWNLMAEAAQDDDAEAQHGFFKPQQQKQPAFSLP